MKKIIPIVVALNLVSCGASSTKKSEKNALYEVLTQQEDGGASV